MSTEVKRYKMDAPEYGLVEADCCSSCEAVKENCADCTAICDNPKEIEWVRNSDYVKLEAVAEHAIGVLASPYSKLAKEFLKTALKKAGEIK